MLTWIDNQVPILFVSLSAENFRGRSDAKFRFDSAETLTL